MFDLLKQDGDINFQAFANIVGVVCNGSLNARLVMLLRLFGVCVCVCVWWGEGWGMQGGVGKGLVEGTWYCGAVFLLQHPPLPLSETPNTRKHPDRVDHEQLAALWRHLSELFQSREQEQAFNETVAVAVTLATDQQVLEAEAPTKAAIAEAEARAAGAAEREGAAEAHAEAGGPAQVPATVFEEPEAAATSAEEPAPIRAVKNARVPPLNIDVSESESTSKSGGGGEGEGEGEGGGGEGEGSSAPLSPPKSATVSVSFDGRPRSGSQWSRASLENMESNPHTETLTFKVFRAAVLSQPLMVAYFENPLPLRL